MDGPAWPDLIGDPVPTPGSAASVDGQAVRSGRGEAADTTDVPAADDAPPRASRRNSVVPPNRHLDDLAASEDGPKHGHETVVPGGSARLEAQVERRRSTVRGLHPLREVRRDGCRLLGRRPQSGRLIGASSPAARTRITGPHRCECRTSPAPNARVGPVECCASASWLHQLNRACLPWSPQVVLRTGRPGSRGR